jgi:hypothetical protein
VASAVDAKMAAMRVKRIFVMCVWFPFVRVFFKEWWVGMGGRTKVVVSAWICGKAGIPNRVFQGRDVYISLKLGFSVRSPFQSKFLRA